MSLETFQEREIEALKAVIAEQHERIEELEAEIERLKNSDYWQQKGREMVGE
jgi:uncharacterized coiled-coil protein SlyX